MLYLVIPAYNEEANIANVILSWHKALCEALGDEPFRILVNDSGSSDSTHKILQSLNLKELQIISNTHKAHGPKLIALYNSAINDNAEWVFQTDSDGQTNPSEFRAFWELRNEYDIILGYRKIRGDGKFRKFVENVVCALLWIFFGVRVRDANAPFRLMKVSILAKYMPNFALDFNLPNIILTAFFAKNNEKMCFREISFQARNAGKNSINFWRIFKIGCKALVDFAKFRVLINNAPKIPEDSKQKGK